MGLAGVRVIALDVAGTVFDWHSCLRDEAAAAAEAAGSPLDAPNFANEWRRALLDGVASVREGRSPWLPASEIARVTLDSLLDRRGLRLPDDRRSSLARAWRRLRPWPGAAEGIQKLRRERPVVALSLLDLPVLMELSRQARIEWDAILSCDFMRRYKNDPEVYRTAASWLGRQPGEVLMVATHGWDLEGAHAAGLQTAFIARPQEWGPDEPSATPPAFVGASVASFDELLAAL